MLAGLSDCIRRTYGTFTATRRITTSAWTPAGALIVAVTDAYLSFELPAGPGSLTLPS